MITLTTLRDLLAAATGPSRDLFIRVAADLGIGNDDPFYLSSGFIRFLDAGAWNDAALALVERMLLACTVEIVLRPPPERCSAAIINGDLGYRSYHSAPTAPLAILRALVAAMVEQENGHD